MTMRRQRSPLFRRSETSATWRCACSLITHLDFRQVLAIAPYPSLVAFCQRFGERPSCRETGYRFDT
jgi:hypothetical protein